MRTSLATNDEPHDVAPGRLEVIRRGDGPTVVAFGPMLTRALEATAHLDATVVYATSLEPFDGRDAPRAGRRRPRHRGRRALVRGHRGRRDRGRVRRCGGSPAVHRGSTPVHPSLRHVAGARRLAWAWTPRASEHACDASDPVTLSGRRSGASMLQACRKRSVRPMPSWTRPSCSPPVPRPCSSCAKAGSRCANERALDLVGAPDRRSRPPRGDPRLARGPRRCRAVRGDAPLCRTANSRSRCASASSRTGSRSRRCATPAR